VAEASYQPSCGHPAHQNTPKPLAMLQIPVR